MKRFLKRWVVWLLALCVLAVGLWVWWDSGRLKMREIGRFTCLSWPGQTETGISSFPQGLLYGSNIPPVVQFIGWDGKERWSIEMPRSGFDAYKHWYPNAPSDFDGGSICRSPDGRILAVSIFETTGVHVMIWRDGQLRGDHHLSVRIDGLYDGKSHVEQDAFNDGRVFLYRGSLSDGMESVFRDNDVLVSERKRTRLSYEPYFDIRTIGGKWKVINGHTGAGWFLPPEAQTGSFRTVLARNGRYVLSCTNLKTEHPTILRAREFISRIPVLYKLSKPSTWREAILIEEPGIIRARSRIYLDEMENGGWGVLETKSGPFAADKAFLAPDGNSLALWGPDGLLFIKFR